MSQFTAGPQGFARSISSNLADNLSQYSRRNSDNASDVEVGSGIGGINTVGNTSTYNAQKHFNVAKKKHKVDKKKIGHHAKKFPELKMMVNGDYRSSNYTMSSDDEVFNVSNILALLYFCRNFHRLKRVFNIIIIVVLRTQVRQLHTVIR